MYSSFLPLLTVAAIAAAYVTCMLSATRRIMFFGTDTDDEQLVTTAARIKEWTWPSDMHRVSYKALMKDVTVLTLSFFQKLFRDTTGDRPYIALAIWFRRI